MFKESAFGLYHWVKVIAFDVDEVKFFEALMQDDVQELVVLLIVGLHLDHEPRRDCKDSASLDKYEELNYNFFNPFPIHGTYVCVSTPQMALLGFFHAILFVYHGNKLTLSSCRKSH